MLNLLKIFILIICLPFVCVLEEGAMNEVNQTSKEELREVNTNFNRLKKKLYEY